MIRVVRDSLRGLSLTALSIQIMFFVVFRKKGDDEYRLFSNQLFDNEKDAEHFGKTSMKKGFEHKVLDYTLDNHERYWYD